MRVKNLCACFFSFPSFSLLLLAAALPFASGVIPVVRFAAERIDVHVYPGEITVEGRYIYRNPFPFPVMQGFTIPFPVDGDHPAPSIVAVERLLPQSEMLAQRQLFSSTSFEAAFSPYEEAEIRVTYRQRTLRPNATYILTTTAPWGAPLEQGVYALHPHGTAIESSNYPLDSSLSFRADNFLPPADWRFSWKVTHE